MEQKPDRPGGCLSQEYGCEPAESVACPHHLYDRLGRRRFCQFPSRYLRTRCKIAGCTRWKVNRVVTKVSLLRWDETAVARVRKTKMLSRIHLRARRSNEILAQRTCTMP